jgi:large conductance mechanosensitive channel
MIKEFTEFLKHYGVIGLAIAVIIGGKLNDLVTAVVGGILMPIVGLATPGGDWRNYVTPGPIKFEVGRVLGSGIDFLIVALIVFWMAKTILREEKVTKK